MTCVVAVVSGSGDITMAGDSFCGDDNLSDICKDPKVYKVGPIGVGLCGNVRSEQILERTIKYHVPRKSNITEKWIKGQLTDIIRKAMKKHGCMHDDDGLHSMKESNYMLAFNGTLYYFDDDFGLWDSARPYTAIGAGKNVAFGSLAQSVKFGLHNEDPENVVLDALEITSNWSPWVMPPFSTVQIFPRK